MMNHFPRDSRPLTEVPVAAVRLFVALYRLYLRVEHEVYGEEGEQLRRAWSDPKTGQEQAAIWYEATDRSQYRVLSAHLSPHFCQNDARIVKILRLSP